MAIGLGLRDRIVRGRATLDFLNPSRPKAHEPFVIVVTPAIVQSIILTKQCFSAPRSKSGFLPIPDFYE